MEIGKLEDRAPQFALGNDGEDDAGDAGDVTFQLVGNRLQIPESFGGERDGELAAIAFPQNHRWWNTAPMAEYFERADASAAKK
jgi:hypothetical protein